MREWRPHPKQEIALKVSPDSAFEILFGGARGGGKDVHHSTLVLTDSGWKKASDVSIMDKLVAPDGTYTKVLGIYPKSNREMYCITFIDGRKIICDKEHKWKVYSKGHGYRDGWVVRTTEKLLNNPSGWSIPLLDKTPGKKWEGADPYILGYILGDGTLTSDKEIIYTVDEETIKYLKNKGWSTHDYKYMNTIMCNPVGREAHTYQKVLGKVSGKNKRIPKILLESDHETRLAVLQGLMDSDGHCEKTGAANFTNKSKGLCEDLIYLVRSLGGKATIHEINRGEREVKGYTSDGHYYKVNVSYVGKFSPFRLSRKKKRLNMNQIEDKLGIVSIEKVKNNDGVCFEVEHDSHLFVIENFIITHNTDAGQAWLLYDHENPKYRGLVIRRNADDLRDWIDRARSFYAGMGDMVGNPPELRFNEGSIVRTGHLKDDNAFSKYQGHEYHRMLVEELTQIPSEEQYLKLIASCRSTVQGLKPQVFANCNPDGPGFSWVKKRFGIEGTPTEPVWTTDPDTGLKRVFIPSRVQDNPTLVDNDPAYVSMLNGLPDGLREAWRDGSWADPIIPGAYYTTALLQARKEGRLTQVPYDPSKKVHTVWDLGIGRQLVVIFVQRDSTGLYMIDCWQGEGSDGLPQAKKMLDTRSYIYGQHFAPHDSSRTETGTGKTIFDSAAALGLNFTPIPNLKIRDGIDKALMMFPRLYIDEEKCEKVIESVRQYRRVWDENKLDWKDQPLHDWTSHFADTIRYLSLVEDMMTGEYTNTQVYLPDYDF